MKGVVLLLAATQFALAVGLSVYVEVKTEDSTGDWDSNTKDTIRISFWSEQSARGDETYYDISGTSGGSTRTFTKTVNHVIRSVEVDTFGDDAWVPEYIFAKVDGCTKFVITSGTHVVLEDAYQTEYSKAGYSGTNRVVTNMDFPCYCGDPVISNSNAAMCTNTDTGSTCTGIACNAGYTLSGSSSISCSTGSWSTKPTCGKTPCPTLSVPNLASSVSCLRNALSFDPPCDVVCQEGYESDVDTVICSSGTWSDEPTCTEIDCDIPDIDNSNSGTACTETRGVGDECTIACNGGYVFSDDTKISITCELGPSWTSGPQCIEKPCEALIIPGSHTECSTIVDDNCEIECDYGYRIVGGTSSFVECLFGGIWSNPQIACEETDCDIPEIDNSNSGTACAERRGVGDECTIGCNGGYVFSDDTKTSITCELGPSWTSGPQCIEKPCEPLIIPGSHTECSTIVDDNCEVECDYGYRIVGGTSSFVECLFGGIWSNSQIACEEITCDDPLIVSSHSSHCAGTKSFDSCEVTCLDGYRVSDVGPMLTCRADGVWTSQSEISELIMPSCDQISCQAPNIPNSNSVHCDNWLPNMDCMVTCNSGFEVYDEFPEVITITTNISCDENGKWGDFPVCTEILNCGPPDITYSNAAVVCGGTDPGALCAFECSQGFLIKTDQGPVIECGFDGEWEPLPRCEQVGIVQEPEIPEQRDFNQEVTEKMNAQLSKQFKNALCLLAYDGEVDCNDVVTTGTSSVSDPYNWYPLQLDPSTVPECLDDRTDCEVLAPVIGCQSTLQDGTVLSDACKKTCENCPVLPSVTSYVNRAKITSLDVQPRNEGSGFYDAYSFVVQDILRMAEIQEEEFNKLNGQLGNLTKQYQEVTLDFGNLWDAVKDVIPKTKEEFFEDSGISFQLDALTAQMALIDSKITELTSDPVVRLRTKLKNEENFVWTKENAFSDPVLLPNWLAEPSPQQLLDSYQPNRETPETVYDFSIATEESTISEKKTFGTKAPAFIGAYNESSFSVFESEDLKTNFQIHIEFSSWTRVQVTPDLWYDSSWLDLIESSDLLDGYSVDGGFATKPIIGKNGVVTSMVRELLVAQDASIAITMDIQFAKQIEIMWENAEAIRFGPFCTGLMCATTGNVIIGTDYAPFGGSATEVVDEVDDEIDGEDGVTEIDGEDGDSEIDVEDGDSEIDGEDGDSEMDVEDGDSEDDETSTSSSSSSTPCEQQSSNILLQVNSENSTETPQPILELHGGWLYIEQAIQSLMNSTTRTTSAPNSIAALGCTSTNETFLSNNAGSAISAIALNNDYDVEFYDTPDRIQTFFDELVSEEVDPKIIWIPGVSDEVENNGFDLAEMESLRLNAFVLETYAASGGGILAHGLSNTTASWLFELLPNLELNEGCNATSAIVSALGKERVPELTNVAVTSTSCGSYFGGDLAGLETAVVDGLGNPFILSGVGGFVEDSPTFSSGSFSYSAATVPDRNQTSINIQFNDEVPRILAILTRSFGEHDVEL